MRRTTSIGLLGVALAIGAIGATGVGTAHAQDTHPIAGVVPDQRPAGAPVIRQVNKDGAWYGRALTGLAPPYPRSFRFLEDQGNWHTPFNRPGMTGRYDIRGWHRSPGE